MGRSAPVAFLLQNWERVARLLEMLGELSRLRSFFATLMRRERFEDSLDEEVRFHLDAYAEDLVRSGVPRREALRRARIHFGSVEGIKDDCRRARGLWLADELDRDLRFATRLLVKERWYTLGAAFVLALAIGVTTAMFTLVKRGAVSRIAR